MSIGAQGRISCQRRTVDTEDESEERTAVEDTNRDLYSNKIPHRESKDKKGVTSEGHLRIGQGNRTL